MVKTSSIASLVLVFLGITIAHFSPEEGAFEIKGQHYQKKLSLSDASGNYVFCKQYDNYLWLRFAVSSDKDGETSDHLDIDIWNYSGPGTYAPADSKSNKREGKRWNIWWHQGDKVYVNSADAQPCELILRQEGDELIGRFGCERLKLSKGEEILTIENGRFNVIPVDGNAK